MFGVLTLAALEAEQDLTHMSLLLRYIQLLLAYLTLILFLWLLFIPRLLLPTILDLVDKEFLISIYKLPMHNPCV